MLVSVPAKQPGDLRIAQELRELIAVAANAGCPAHPGAGHPVTRFVTGMKPTNCKQDEGESKNRFSLVPGRRRELSSPPEWQSRQPPHRGGDWDQAEVAGEMKLRLREELGRAGQSAADLDLAFVGTIHSFCARLLRERTVEAGVDPRFEELAEEEASALFAMVFRRWVESRLSEPNPVLRRALTRLTWRDDGEGRDPLTSLRNAAWTLIDWRDHPATWSRRPFDRTAALDSIIAGTREVTNMRREGRPGDLLVSPGPYPFTAQVSDSAGNLATQALTLTVSPCAVNFNVLPYPGWPPSTDGHPT